MHALIVVTLILYYEDLFSQKSDYGHFIAIEGVQYRFFFYLP